MKEIVALLLLVVIIIFVMGGPNDSWSKVDTNLRCTFDDRGVNVTVQLEPRKCEQLIKTRTTYCRPWNSRCWEPVYPNTTSPKTAN